MKCPNCGAETQGKVCEYCNSEIVQEQPQGGACPKCGNNNVTFKRERVGTATKSSSQKNIIGSGRTGHSVSHSSYRTVGVCQNCGYTWNPNADEKKSSGRKTWLWVLGWIFIFPVPLTILMLRKKDMKPVIKYGIIAVAWILFLVIGLAGGSESDTTQDDTNNTTVQAEQIETTNETTERNPFAAQEATIRKFVSEFNEISDTPVTDIEFRKNHTIAYLVIDGFDSLSIKVNNHSELGFFFTFEFSNGTASLEKYENLMKNIIKVFDENVEVGEKFQEAKSAEDTVIAISDTISVKYHYIKDAVGYQVADTYIIELTSTDYNK